jgi:hypothetical protein
MVQAGPDTEQFLVVIGECLGAFDVRTETGGYRCVLASEALTDRSPNAASTPGHESDSAAKCFATLARRFLLFGVQTGHATSPLTGL